MRSFLSTLALLLVATTATADVIAGLAGSIDNAAQAASLQTAAKVLSSGAYTFTNVATGKALTYEPEGNHIVPSSGAGSPVNILGYGNGVSWVRLQIGDKDKCLSSQWGGSYNLAGVMYSCAVDEGGDVTRQDNTLEPTKQWWLLVPVGEHTGDSDASNRVLLAAQDESVQTRESALKKAASAHFKSKKHSRRHAHSLDLSPRRFELVSRSQKARKSWRDAEEKKTKAAAVKKASSAKTKVSSTKKKAATKAKKTTQKAKSGAKKTKTSTSKSKVKATKKVATKAKKTSAKKAVSSKKAVNKKVAGSGLNVKLNVAVNNNRYFIIPVDHLIDMHTLALTGHEIESYRAQSTALDLWDSSNKYQQWTISPAK
ncbi:hypothetical protein JCM11641_002296 [Rhodosporidiobolus odoratus]